jgi:Holliday junction DNA helicase RuvB
MNEILDGKASENDLAFESALRPTSLSEFIGQAKVKQQLDLLLKAASLQSRCPDHILLAGPPGLPAPPPPTGEVLLNLTVYKYKSLYIS